MQTYYNGWVVMREVLRFPAESLIRKSIALSYLIYGLNMKQSGDS